MSGIKRKFLFQLLYAFSQLAFPLITYPYITRTIGAAGLGLIGYVEYVSGFIITIASFGIPFYGVREAARLQNQPQQLALLFRQLFSIQFVISCIGIIVFIGIISLSKQEIPLPLLALGCATILLPPFVAEWYMQGIEAFRFTTIRSILLRAVGLVVLFLFVTSAADYIYYFLIIVLVQVAVAITNLYKAGYNNTGLSFSGYRKHIKPLWHFFLTASIISIYVFFDVIILGWFTDEISVGYYTLAIKLVKLSLLLVLSLNVILFPRISHLTASNDGQSVELLLQKGMSFIILLTLPLCAGFFFLSPYIVRIIAGQGFVASVPLVQTLSAIPFLIGLGHLFVYQVLIPYDKQKNLLLSAFITCVCSLLLHITFVQLFKEKGTAFATLLTELIMTLLVCYFALKAFPFSFPAKIFLQTVVALLPFIALVILCDGRFTNDIVIVTVSVVGGAAFYFLMQLLVFKNALAREAVLSLRFGKTIKIANG